MLHSVQRPTIKYTDTILFIILTGWDTSIRKNIRIKQKKAEQDRLKMLHGTTGAGSAVSGRFRSYRPCPGGELFSDNTLHRYRPSGPAPRSDDDGT